MKIGGLLFQFSFLSCEHKKYICQLLYALFLTTVFQREGKVFCVL